MQAQYGVSLQIGGQSIQRTVIVTGDHPNLYEVAIPAAKSGTLTTRTDDNTGTITSNGHGIADATVVDVYWAGGARYGMTVGSGATNTFVVDGGAGDNLPVQTTPLTISPQVSVNCHIDGDAIQIIGIELSVADPSAATYGRALFEDAGGDDIADLELLSGSAQVYHVAGGSSNPFSGDPITSCKASNANSSYAATLKIYSLEDSTP